MVGNGGAETRHPILTAQRAEELTPQPVLSSRLNREAVMSALAASPLKTIGEGGGGYSKIILYLYGNTFPFAVPCPPQRPG